MSLRGLEGKGRERKAYNDVSFDKARDSIEDALCAARLFLAPERKTFRKVFVAMNENEKDVSPGVLESRRWEAKTPTSTCARHAELRVGEPRRTVSIVYSVLDPRRVFPGIVGMP